jgi:hypothetical protein
MQHVDYFTNVLWYVHQDWNCNVSTAVSFMLHVQKMERPHAWHFSNAMHVVSPSPSTCCNFMKFINSMSLPTKIVDICFV